MFVFVWRAFSVNFFFFSLGKIMRRLSSIGEKRKGGRRNKRCEEGGKKKKN